ncbi:two-component regulator propeller domain-containing protein [Chitinophaga sp. XS-30]|uniref:ligand-binding sensor domain-containing protein n=1 Tax=Chitinophaga sp. XS-30 TaxID=2604421 RepID=UPI0011DDA181|nr:two-component regulator propeller domain-containing protein [Chitinophaga sp. XS-30]QEH43576.1 histidine kinase [Chitinophaga sp. XS-30]
MKYILIYILFLMSVFHTSCGQNQTNLPKDNSYSEPKDIVTSYGPNIMIRNIKQDRNGNILIAGSNTTAFGDVFRYDGKYFTNLTSKLGSHRFWDVLEDRRGNLWFASLDSGVYYYNGETFQHFTTREGLANNMVMSIYEDTGGNIWFGGNGLSRYDGKSFQNFTTKDGLPNNSTRAIIEDKTGKLWIATLDGPCFYDGKAFTVLKDKDGKAFKNVWSVIEDKKGNIWFGDNNGLWRYDGSTFTKVSQKGAYAIIEDKNGNIWTTGADEPPGIEQAWSLSRYDHKSLYDKKPAVTEIISGPPAFLGLLEADDGSIWFGGLGPHKGVHRYDGKTIKDFRRKEDQQ